MLFRSNGPHTHPLYTFLKEQKPGIFGTERIKWNFTKFLVGRKGHLTGRYAPTVEPKSLAAEIELLLESE